MVGRPAPDRDLIWVCDGYTQYNSTFCSDGDLITTASLYLHMNWGWHELYCNPPQNQTDYPLSHGCEIHEPLPQNPFSSEPTN